ncbi:MAG: hypothetical protein AAGA89_10085 [Pseudomonadota bacterium]
MRVDDKYARFAIAALFLLGGIYAFLVRGESWPWTLEQISLGPHHSQIAHARLEAAFLEDEYDEALIQGLSEDIIAMTPLSPAPYEALLLLEIEREEVRDEMVATLARATLAREARSLSARLFIIDQATFQGDWDTVFDEFSTISRLWPTEAGALMEMLYESLDDEAWIPVFRTYLQTETPWVERFVQGVPVDQIGVEVAIELHQPFEDLHATLLRKLNQSFGLEAVHEAWSALQPAEAEKAKFGLVAPDFAPSTALQPFNWTIDDSYAEYDRNSGLYITYRGSGRPVFAAQLIFLEPGQHRLMSQLSEKPSDPPGDVVWNIRCVEDGRDLVDVSLFDPAFESDAILFDFEVPEDCAYQRLALLGFPGRFTRRFNVSIGSIGIEQLGKTP